MKQHSENPPPCAFLVEPMPGQPGKARIRFFENAEKITERTHWEFDEYRLVVDEQAGIDGMVMENYADMIEQAKLAEDSPDESLGKTDAFAAAK